MLLGKNLGRQLKSNPESDKHFFRNILPVLPVGDLLFASLTHQLFGSLSFYKTVNNRNVLEIVKRTNYSCQVIVALDSGLASKLEEAVWPMKSVESRDDLILGVLL